MMIINKTSTAPRKPLGLYIHIPFCIQKCNYCDFLSFGGVPEEGQKAYFRSLLHGIKTYHEIYSKQYYVDSIFIGGGTPSLVEAGLIEELMAEIRDCFIVDQNAEISIETNPKTLTKNKMHTYLEAGINRLSIGAQSFDDALLRTMGRVHSAEDFLGNYALARECGFRNINIDLMFAIPGQTMSVWMDTLEKAIELEPEHISFYSLQMEEGTPFFSMSKDGSIKEIEDALDRNMYHRAVKALKNCGYQHYEISNAAKAGYSCRHNLKYWSMEDYLGLGLGAHSFMDGIRFSQIEELTAYTKGALRKEKGGAFVAWEHKNTRQDDISEYIITGMRKREGINLRDFETRFEQTIEDIFSANWYRLKKYIEDDYIVKSAENMHFTIKGIDISNTILTEFV